MALTNTIIDSQTLANGLRRVTLSSLCDNAYPVAGYALTPAMYGLTRFKSNKSGGGLVQPKVVSVTPTVLLARVIGQQLLVSYPSGGATAGPTTPAAPIVTAGATPVTSTAATGVLTAGIGQNLPNASDLSAVTIVTEVEGVV